MHKHRYSPTHRMTPVQRYLLILFGTLFVLTLAIMTVAPPTKAAEPSTRNTYAPCVQGWQAPESDRAAQCRAKGWRIGARYTVSPSQVLRYYDLPRCPEEDGAKQSCGWNVDDKDGDGCGYVYLALRSTDAKGRHHTEYVYLYRWHRGHLVQWQRWDKTCGY